MYGEIVYNLLETKNLPWINCLFLIASGSDSLNKTNPELSIKLMTDLKCNSSKSIFPSCKVNTKKPCLAYGNMVPPNSRNQWWTSTRNSPDSDCTQSTVLAWLKVCVHMYVILCSLIVIHILIYFHVWNVGL